MPTENRSSNTEMVSVPEGYMLVERSIWTEQQVEAATASITLMKGVPGTRDRDLAMAAIDAAQCKAPDITLADLLPAQQGQGEPVALAIPDECPHIIVFDDADQSDEYFCGAGARPAALRRLEQISRSWNAHLFVRVARNSRDDRYPSATVNDPAEVERLRNCLRTEVEAGDSWKREAEELRAQLAEAQALLNDVIGDIHFVIASDTRQRIDAHLSASAEPRAPIDPDQLALDCATEVMAHLEQVVLPGGRSQLKAQVQCRVRAALDRKS